MYENLSKGKEKIAGNRKLVTLVCISVAIMLLVTAVLVGAYLYYGSFREFVSDFSSATSVTYRKGSVWVTTQGEEFVLADENVYYVYNAIVNAGRGRLADAPERIPDAVLEYQFGGKLELWEVDLENSTSSRRGLFVRFTNLDGEIYAYDTDRLALDRLPLSAKQNKTGE